VTSDPQRQDEQTAAQPDEVPAEGQQPLDGKLEPAADDMQQQGTGDSSEGQPTEGEPAPEAGSTEPAEADQQAEVEAAGDAQPEPEEEETPQWYILKVQVNREESIRRALERRIKIAGLENYFGDIVVPTEDVAEYNKSGKRRIVKKKLYPGYIMINLVLNDDTWFLVRETPGIGDFTGSAGKPTPMEPHEVQRIVAAKVGGDTGEAPVKTSIPFKSGDRVRVKEGYFENFEGEVAGIDEANGRVTVMINIFGRSTPVELEHWQVESV
jgi:transcriptional antiterminator NusG